MAIRAFAPAKVNLALHLTGLRADGYHLLDSLVVFAGVGDWLTADPADDLTLSLHGPKSAGVPSDGSNLVLRAALHLRALRGVTAGAALRLEKHLPHGGGIGGGSSDAAAALRALARLWNVAPLTGAEALPLGADIPVCLMAPSPTRMQGVGEVLCPVPALPQGWLLLVNPGIHVSTVAAFRRHDARNPPPSPPLAQVPAPAEFTSWLHAHANDLTQTVTAPDLAPAIADILNRLRQTAGCLAANMSGSGSTCWAWFSGEPAARAAAATFADQPEWWVAPARVLHAKDGLL